MTLEAERSGSRTVPKKAQELHDRTHVYLSSIPQALVSVEDLLALWNRFRAASASAADGLPEQTALRRVRIDPYTLQMPPPTVSVAEVDAAVKRLSAKELKALHTEFELTCVDDFAFVPEDPVGTGTERAAVVAARTVRFADDTDSIVGDPASSDQAADEAKPVKTEVQAFIDMSATSRATALFGSGVVTMDVLRSGGAAAGESSEAVMTAAGDDASGARTPPVISLERMPPSIASNGRGVASSGHAREGGGAVANLYESDTAASSAAAITRRPPATDAGCTVELEYASDHWIPSSTRRVLQEDTGATITVTSASSYAAPTSPPPSPPRQEEAPDMESATESEADGDSDGGSHSFTTFSRMVLAKATRRIRATPALATALSVTEAVEATDGEKEEERWEERPAEQPRPSTPPPPRDNAATANKTASAPVPPAAPTPPAAAQPTRDIARERDAFVRMRVRDILLANRVREADTALLGAAFFDKMDKAWNATADQTTPVLQRLDEMLCESSSLLHALEMMDHQAYRERVMDPAQYLCVPRYSACCAAPDCATPFSTTVTRVMCGRCGQFLCPKCCGERGLGPDVVCNGKRYSLGWESLCRLCFSMCYDSQLKVLEERRQMLGTAARPTNGSLSGGHDRSGCSDADEAAGAHLVGARDLSLKEAILFGAYCHANNCLGDGLPPFYVAHRNANESVAFWDMLGYHCAKSTGSLRRGWQSAGGMAAKVVSNATHLVAQRKATLR